MSATFVYTVGNVVSAACLVVLVVFMVIYVLAGVFGGKGRK